MTMKQVITAGTRGLTLQRSDGVFVFPGFCDVHVHFREPGFSYKETIVTGSRAAARGGYTAVCAMPNLDPVPDSEEHLVAEETLIHAAGGGRTVRTQKPVLTTTGGM